MFKNKYLAVIAYANGYTMWNYRDMNVKLDDVINKQEYFKEIFNLAAVGDIIQVIANNGAAEVVVYKIAEKTCFIKPMCKVYYED